MNKTATSLFAQIPTEVIVHHIAAFMDLTTLGRLYLCSKSIQKSFPDEYFKPFVRAHHIKHQHPTMTWLNLARKSHANVLLIGTSSTYCDPVQNTLSEAGIKATMWQTDMHGDTPSLEEMRKYQVIFAFGDNSSFVNADKFCKNLELCLRLGCGVVACSFCNCTNVTEGHFEEPMQSLLPVPLGSQASLSGDNMVLQPTDAKHFLFHDLPAVLPHNTSCDTAIDSAIRAGKILCHFTDASNTVAIGENDHGKGKLVAFNFFPYMNEPTQVLLCANAILYVAK